MTETTARVPAADQVDHRAIAYNAALNLAEMTHSFDSRFRHCVEIEVSGRTTIHMLNGGSPQLRDAAQLAARLGLGERTWSDTQTNRHHNWAGTRSGIDVRVVWLENLPACCENCAKPVLP